VTHATNHGRPVTLEAILGRTSEIAESHVRRNAPLVDQHAAWPEENLRALQSAGLGGLVVPVERGGLGQGLYALVRVSELLGRECASTAITFGMHHVGTAVIAAKVTPEQQARYLDPINAGQHLTTLALSEPGTGAHFYYPETQLTPTGAGTYVINGAKTFVTNGGHADSYVASVRSSDESIGDFSCVILPSDTPGMTWGEPWNGLGMRGNAARALTLDSVRVLDEHLLGSIGDQIWYVLHVVAPYFLMAMTGTYLGVADGALREAIRHLKARQYTHNGRTPAQETVIQSHVASLWEDVERTRQLTYAAARLADAGSPSALPLVLSSKAAVADTAVRVVNDAMTLMGGIVYRDGSSLERHLRDVRAAHVMTPTTHLLRTWTGRVLLDQPLFGE